MAKAKATTPEATTEVAVHDEAWAKYQAEQEAKSGNRRPTPPGLRLNGKTGVFSRSEYNADSKETEFKDLEEKSFDGVILAVRYLARWKWRENAVFSIGTKEFKDFKNERIELIKRENVAGAVPVSKFYANYAEFKETVASVDKETGESKSPFDLLVSLYVLVNGEIIRFRGKGETRSAWFTYTQSVKSPKTVVTAIGASDLITERDGKAVPVPYYHATFTSKGDVPAELRGQVIEAANDLDTWFASFTQEQVKPVSAGPAHELIGDDEEIDVTQIPF